MCTRGVAGHARRNWVSNPAGSQPSAGVQPSTRSPARAAQHTQPGTRSRLGGAQSSTEAWQVPCWTAHLQDLPADGSTERITSGRHGAVPWWRSDRAVLKRASAVRLTGGAPVVRTRHCAIYNHFEKFRPWQQAQQSATTMTVLQRVGVLGHAYLCLALCSGVLGAEPNPPTWPESVTVFKPGDADIAAKVNVHMHDLTQACVPCRAALYTPTYHHIL